MKWIRVSLIVLAGILAGVLFAAHDQRVEVDPAAGYTVDPMGNLYLLSEEAVLTKISSQGQWLWDVELPGENADGEALRYLDLISDNSGGLYLVTQTYERRVDAARAVGARGGTVIQARGAGSHEAEKFFGISIQPEKEIVLILTTIETKKSIMKAVCQSAGLKTPGRGLTFSLPVDDVMGMAMGVPVEDGEESDKT